MILRTQAHFGSRLVGTLLLAGFLSGVCTAQTTTPPPQVRVVVLRPHGFEPRAFTVPTGRVLLVVLNRTGIRQVKLRLGVLGALPLRDVTLPVGRLAWREVVDLLPGSYVVSEADHPNWTCAVTVRP